MAGTRRSTMTRLPGRRRKGFWPVATLWFRRFGFGVLVIGGLIWLGSWVWLSGSIQSARDWAHEGMIEASARAGFTVRNILVEGREFSDGQAILARINVEAGDPLFSFAPLQARSMLEQMEWVQRAHVERRWPDTIYIRLYERQPLALWQKDKTLWLLDTQGQVIHTDRLGRFEDLLIVIGDEAPQKAAELIANLNAEPALAGKVEAASWVGGRRWDLLMRSKIRVKLPETDIGLAMRQLANMQEEQGLLAKDLKEIDLREPDRMIVQPQSGKIRTYGEEQKTGNDI